MKKRLLKYFIWTVIVVFIGLTVRFIEHKKNPSLLYSEKIHGEIIYVYNERGGFFFDLSNEKKFRVRLNNGNFDVDDLLSNYTDFDTIYKHANSDTLYFRRDGKLKYALIYYKKGK